MLSLLRDGKGEKEDQGVEAEAMDEGMFEVRREEMLEEMVDMEDLDEVEVVAVHLEV